MVGTEINSTSGGEMNDESIKYALIGLKAYLDKHNIKQKAFAAGVTTSEHFSKILNVKAGASGEMIRRLATKAGLEPAELVLLGKNSDEKQTYYPPPPEESKVIPGMQANHINPMDVLASLARASAEVSTLVGQYIKLDERMRFWRLIFDSLPIPTLVIKDGLVIYQNIKSRIWGNITGDPICKNCIGGDCVDKSTCPVQIAIETVTETSGYRTVEGNRYKIDTIPLKIAEHEYFIVTATSANEDGADRRGGVEDRREDEQGE